MNEVRAMSVCYRLLARMGRDAQLASLKWLSDRLRDDHEKAMRARRGLLSKNRLEISRAVGDAALSLLSMLRISGGSSAKRIVEFRGPINADIVVHVKPTADLQNSSA